MDEKVVVVKVPAPMDVEKKKTAAASVEEISKWALPVKSSSSKQINKNKPAGFRMPLLSVRVILGWAFVHAVAVALTLAIAALIVHANITIPASVKGPDLTPAQAADEDFFWDAFLWLSLPEGVAATVGLLLPRRHARARWSLSLLAIVSATAAHCVYARMVSVDIVADKSVDIRYRILVGGAAVVFLVVDLLGLLSLLIGGPEPNE